MGYYALDTGGIEISAQFLEQSGAARQICGLGATKVCIAFVTQAAKT